VTPQIRELRLRDPDGSYVGTLIKPEDGAELDVTVTRTSDGAAEAVVRRFLLSKTLRLERRTKSGARR
jgi:hypothetical protein